MKCPHCLVDFHDAWAWFREPAGGSTAIEDPEGHWSIAFTTCPNCKKITVKLRQVAEGKTRSEVLVRPKGTARAPLAPEVPKHFAADYREACLVLGDSPKASAALARRCLQNLLREHFKVKRGNLSSEIDEVLPKLPSHLSDAVDGVRNYGNFAAHPMKSTNTGEVLDVEPGEAEWCLDVLESLFDFCFVQPEALRKKKQTLNEKLKEAGKPPMK